MVRGKIAYFAPVMKHLLILIGCCCSLWAVAQEKPAVYQGYSGGMMLHTGYLFGTDPQAPVKHGRTCSPQGATFGIGGAIRVHLLQHLRIGTEGYVSTMNSGMTDCSRLLQKGSYLRSGWGGLLADAYWKKDRWIPYLGMGVGGGSLKGLYLLEGSQDDWAAESNAVAHKTPFVYVAPYVGVNFSLTKKIQVSLKIDWMLAFHQSALVMPTGPRAYIGFMVNH